MTDLEITKLCAEAMAIQFVELVATDSAHQSANELTMAALMAGYDPLHDDAQAMALVKKFQISIAWSWADQIGCMSRWEAEQDENRRISDTPCTYKDLNRAICECVAKMEKAKCMSHSS